MICIQDLHDKRLSRMVPGHDVRPYRKMGLTIFKVWSDKFQWLTINSRTAAGAIYSPWWRKAV